MGRPFNPTNLDPLYFLDFYIKKVKILVAYIAYLSGRSSVWLERYLGVVEAAGSSPVAPTKIAQVLVTWAIYILGKPAEIRPLKPLHRIA